MARDGGRGNGRVGGRGRGRTGGRAEQNRKLRHCSPSSICATQDRVPAAA